MNRKARLTILSLASLLALMPLAGAQTNTPPGSTAQPGSRQSGTMPRTGQPGRPLPTTFSLVRKVDSLNVLAKSASTALSRTQAAQLVTLLKPLGTQTTLTEAQASRLSGSIDQILTSAQRTALTQAGNQMGRGRMPGDQRAQTPPPSGNQAPAGPRPFPQGPNSQDGRQPDGQMSGRNGTGQPRPGGQLTPDANPFQTGRGGQALNNLLNSLQK